LVDPEPIDRRDHLFNPERQRDDKSTRLHTTEDKKVMLMMAWNTSGFHFVNTTPHGRTVNADNARHRTLPEYRTFVRRIGWASPHIRVIHTNNQR
jgi:hypothetical protein